MSAATEVVGDIVARPDAAEVRTLATSLAAALDSGWSEEADRLLARITGLHEGALYHEIGRLARGVHGALQSFAADARIAELASNELPDAKQRLSYVMERTEDAAHRTLAAIEATQPLVRVLGEDAGQLADSVARLRRRELGPGEFRELVVTFDEFLARAVADSGSVSTHLNDALLAQEFQDLTGQVLRRVTDLVQELEGHLVGLLQAYGAASPRTPIAVAAVEAEGPAIEATSEHIQDQDEVDALLSDLGF